MVHAATPVTCVTGIQDPLALLPLGDVPPRKNHLLEETPQGSFTAQYPATSGILHWRDSHAPD